MKKNLNIKKNTLSKKILIKLPNNAQILIDGIFIIVDMTTIKIVAIIIF